MLYHTQMLALYSQPHLIDKLAPAHTGDPLLVVHHRGAFALHSTHRPSDREFDRAGPHMYDLCDGGVAVHAYDQLGAEGSAESEGIHVSIMLTR